DFRFEASQGGMLSQRWCANRQARSQLFYGWNDVRWSDKPAQAPSRHMKILREAVDNDDVLIDRQSALRRIVIIKSQIDLVHNDKAVALPYFGDQLFQVLSTYCGSRWIAERCNQDATGGGIP